MCESILWKLETHFRTSMAWSSHWPTGFCRSIFDEYRIVIVDHFLIATTFCHLHIPASLLLPICLFLLAVGDVCLQSDHDTWVAQNSQTCEWLWTRSSLFPSHSHRFGSNLFWWRLEQALPDCKWSQNSGEYSSSVSIAYDTRFWYYSRKQSKLVFCFSLEMLRSLQCFFPFLLSFKMLNSLL